MTYLLAMPAETGNGEVLVFEVDRSEVPGDLVLASSDPERTVDRARVTLEEALGKLKPSLQKVVHALTEFSPAETEVEFGIKIGGEAGMIIAKGTAEVNFRIRMCWRSEKPAVTTPAVDHAGRVDAEHEAASV